MSALYICLPVNLGPPTHKLHDGVSVLPPHSSEIVELTLASQLSPLPVTSIPLVCQHHPRIQNQRSIIQTQKIPPDPPILSVDPVILEPLPCIVPEYGDEDEGEDGGQSRKTLYDAFTKVSYSLAAGFRMVPDSRQTA